MPTTPSAVPTTTTTTTALAPVGAAPTPTTSSVIPAISSVSAYWVVASDGGVFAFGGAPFYGSTGNIHLNQAVVGMAPTSPTNFGGYREVASDGGIFSYGNAQFFGSTGNIHLNQPVVGMTATPSGNGYWLVAADGGIFAYGDAGFYGSTGNIHLNQPIVGMASTSDGHGYWLVASDGGVFSFGDATFQGSTGGLRLTAPIVSMVATGSNHGYLLAAADGGIFAFGDAPFHGSLVGTPLLRPIVSMAATPDVGGYWFTNNNGAVTALGNATYWGSTPQVLAAPVVGITEAAGTGSFVGSSYPSGSYGYDISNYQCGAYPPPPHTISIVEVNGASFGQVNDCLAGEATWAGAGLNLYGFLTYGEVVGNNAACVDSVVPNTCNYGFNAGMDALTKARNSGINTNVPWWLDVEPTQAPQPAWSVYQTANAALVNGYLAALHSQGIANVGIYTSPLTWGGIVGSYAPALPLWLAWYTGNPQQNCSTGYTGASLSPYTLPTGGIVLTQYGIGTINGNQYDQDYAC